MSPALIQAVVLAFEALQDIRKSLLEKGEWTPEQESAFNAKSEKVLSQPHWKVEGT
jgi:hypothetical protein